MSVADFHMEISHYKGNCLRFRCQFSKHFTLFLRVKDDVSRKPWSFVDQLRTAFEPNKEVPAASIIQKEPLPEIEKGEASYPYTFSKDMFSNLRVSAVLFQTHLA